MFFSVEIGHVFRAAMKVDLKLLEPRKGWIRGHSTVPCFTFPKVSSATPFGRKKGSIVEMWTAESRFNKIPVWKEQEKTMLSHRPWPWRGDNHCGPKFDPEIFVARTVRTKCRPQTAADHCFHHANDGEKRIVPLLSNPENNGLQSAFCTVQ